jgi:cell division protein FtsB
MPHQSRVGDAGLRQKAALLTCVIAIIGLLLGALFGDRGYLRLLDKRDRTDALAHDVDRLESENVRLAAEIRALKTEPRAIERIAREQLGLARPGETVFLLPDERAEGVKEER